MSDMSACQSCVICENLNGLQCPENSPYLEWDFDDWPVVISVYITT